MNPELDQYVNQQPEALKIELTPQEVNVLFAALSELPHRVADPLMRKIAFQVNPKAE